MAEVSVSVLDVDKENSVKTFYNLETAKPNYFHIDVMDGKFVKNNNLEKMKDYTLEIHNISMTPIEVHLMVENPKEVIEDFIDLGINRVIFHIESCENEDEVKKIAKYLVENGVNVGVAINPDTNINKIYEVLPYIHLVLVMTVVPGEGGQKLIPKTLNKIEELKKYCEENNIDIDIEADGGINDSTAEDVVNAGADILVSGNYILSSEDYNKVIKFLKNI